jgi:chorismate synthase
MASNSFGNLFKITTWGESHGRAIGVVIDGCPAGLNLTIDDINQELAKRAPGRNKYATPRTEPDKAEIYSGVFEGKTTGAPISIIILNQDVDSSKYESIKNLLRPGHANFTYLNKYGIYDYLGGGRASARETACRVAAGAVAKKILNYFNITVCAYLKTIGDLDPEITLEQLNLKQLKQATYDSPVFCPDFKKTDLIIDKLLLTIEQGDSIGGLVECVTSELPIGLGDPVYEKLEANLAKAMLSIPASKGFEIGEGFASAVMNGSVHNDLFTHSDYNNKIQTLTNQAGGTLGGISTGMPLICRVAFKPTSSIKKSQETINITGEKAVIQLPNGSRHDPCVAIRAVPVVEAMTALVLIDSLLMNRCVKL